MTTDASQLFKGFTKYVACPIPYFMGSARRMTTSGNVLGVWCHPDEQVEWYWNNGRVCGYSVKPIAP